MNSVEEVKVAKDNGQKARWGIKRFLYRQEGRKLTLKYKHILSAVVVVFILSSFFAITRGPVEAVSKAPMAVNNVIVSGDNFEVPVAIKGEAKARSESRGQGFRVGGLSLIKRPAFGKVPPGTMGRAKLIGGASNGPVSAILLEPVEVAGESVIEAGTKLFGTGSSGEDRLAISFSKLVSKEGAVQDVKAQACDQSDKTVGIKGSKVNKYTAQLAAGIALNFAGGAAAALQQQQVSGGVAYNKPSLGNAALQGVATASLEQSKALAEKWKQDKSIIQVESGTEICLLFEGQ